MLHVIVSGKTAQHELFKSEVTFHTSWHKRYLSLLQRTIISASTVLNFHLTIYWLEKGMSFEPWSR